jgi:hypothetical protein
MSEVWNTCLRFERFAETGAKHIFRLRSGQEFLGWVMEVGEDAILFACAPSPFYAQAAGTEEMSPPDEWVRFADIELSSLAYWDDVARRWIDFPEAEPGSASDHR